MMDLELIYTQNRDLYDTIKEEYDRLMGSKSYGVDSGVIGPFNLQTEIWSLESGVYKPVGFLKMPVSAEMDSPKVNNGNISLFTPLADHYFRGESVVLHYDKGSECTIDSLSAGITHLGGWTHEEINVIETIEYKISPKLLTNHIQNYFETVQNAKSGKLKLSEEESRLLKSIYTSYE